MYSDFVFLDRFLFELSCKNTHTHTQTHTHRDSNEYPIVAFSKNATITRTRFLRESIVVLACTCSNVALFINVFVAYRSTFLLILPRSIF